jgi:hypothetical protein
MQQLSRPGASSASVVNGTLRLTTGGYGFGLRVATNCLFAHIVSHTGGLPGFGSLMMWLPEYGVGIIAFGNKTYSGWTGTANRAFEILAPRLQPREPVPSPALLSAARAVSRLVMNGWDDRLVDSLAAVNLYLDKSRDRRRAELEGHLKNVGKCGAWTDQTFAENALRGQWMMPCERGDLRVSITLAPTMPPKVQFLEVTPVPPAAPATLRPRMCTM